MSQSQCGQVSPLRQPDRFSMKITSTERDYDDRLVVRNMLVSFENVQLDPPESVRGELSPVDHVQICGGCKKSIETDVLAPSPVWHNDCGQALHRECLQRNAKYRNEEIWCPACQDLIVSRWQTLEDCCVEDLTVIDGGQHLPDHDVCWICRNDFKGCEKLIKHEVCKNVVHLEACFWEWYSPDTFLEQTLPQCFICQSPFQTRQAPTADEFLVLLSTPQPEYNAPTGSWTWEEGLKVFAAENIDLSSFNLQSENLIQSLAAGTLGKDRNDAFADGLDIIEKSPVRTIFCVHGFVRCRPSTNLTTLDARKTSWSSDFLFLHLVTFNKGFKLANMLTCTTLEDLDHGQHAAGELYELPECHQRSKERYSGHVVDSHPPLKNGLAIVYDRFGNTKLVLMDKAAVKVHAPCVPKLPLSDESSSELKGISQITRPDEGACSQRIPCVCRGCGV